MPKKALKKTSKPTTKTKTNPADDDAKKQDRVLLQVWVPTDVYAWMGERAKADERSLASYVRRVFGRMKEEPKLLERVET